MANFFKPQVQKKTTTKHHEYDVIKLDHQGDGIAFFANKAVFIPGALPNEKVLAQLIQSKKQYSKAKLIKVLEPSTDRVTPFCPYYQDCGGCSLQHLDHAQQIILKQQIIADSMTKFSGQKPIAQSPAIISKPIEYRRRTKLSVIVNKHGELVIGFRKRASNDIINISHCPVLNKNLDTILGELHPLLSKLKSKHFIGHIELSASNQGTVLLIRATKNLHHTDIENIRQFAKQQSLALFIKQTDDKMEQLVGQQPYYLLDGLQINYHPQDFIQVNEDINQKMVSQAIDWLEINQNDLVLDLFCGLGNFSLSLAKRAKRVVGIEGVKAMVLQATHNAKLNSLENVEFYHANLASNILNMNWFKVKYQKILLDPARAGAFEIMHYLAKSGAKKLLYVSCNPATLARDSQVLLENGYKLTKLGLLDMFPNTGHLEAMALFTKV